MRSRRWLPPVLLMAALAGCHDPSDLTRPPERIPAGAMAYTGFDEHGVSLVRGWVKLDVLIITSDPGIPSNVTGTWKLRRVCPYGEIGPQVGEGSLEGLLQNDRLVANLNPGKVDDHVVLDGPLEVIGDPPSGTHWEGRWTWNAPSGPKRSGTFRARS